MFKTILVPTDGTSLSDIAITNAIEFAKINPGSKIIGISVAELIPFSAVEGLGGFDVVTFEQRLLEVAQKYVSKVAAAAKSAGIPCETYTAQSATPYEEILKAADRYQCDCIFMASHGRKGLNLFFLGSNTQKVLAQASIPVMVYRQGETSDTAQSLQAELAGF